MEPENTTLDAVVEQKSALHRITPLSKYLAMALFVALPFVGGWVGYTFAPMKIVEVNTIPKETDVSVQKDENPIVQSAYELEVLASSDGADVGSGLQLRAFKEGNEVKVYTSDNDFASESLLFTYTETYPKDDSGNYWRGLDASVALSPDKTKIAFADEEGVKVRSLSDGSERMIHAHRTSDNENAIFADPQWSPDGNVIAVRESQYEGQKIVFLSVANPGTVMAEKFGGGQLVWHSEKPILVNMFINVYGGGTTLSIFNFTNGSVLEKEINLDLAFEFLGKFTNLSFFADSDILTFLIEANPSVQPNTQFKPYYYAVNVVTGEYKAVKVTVLDE